jgi:hypothetical protein
MGVSELLHATAAVPPWKEYRVLTRWEMLGEFHTWWRKSVPGENRTPVVLSMSCRFTGWAVLWYKRSSIVIGSFLTPRCGGVLWRIKVTQLVKNSPPFVEPESSLSCSREPVLCVRKLVLSFGGCVREFIQKFLDWPPATRTANGTAICR